MQNKFLKNDEYPPSEDTFFIANYIENEKGEYALDVGSGSGYLTKLLCESFSFVVGTDINCEVLRHQSSYKTDNLICCNSSDALKIKFDFIVSVECSKENQINRLIKRTNLNKKNTTSSNFRHSKINSRNF